MQIGGKLRSGVKHDGRAPDYDDWSLNGDIMFWNELLGCAFEVSSMGIRVDAESLDSQLAEAGAEDRKRFLFHRLLLDGTLPLTHGRRHRSVEALYAVTAKSTYRRSPMLYLGRCHQSKM